MNNRPSLGFGEDGNEDPLDQFDIDKWSPDGKKAKSKKAIIPKIEKAAEESGFSSREPAQKKKTFQRRRRTGRNVQFNIKAKQETIDAFTDVADRYGWGLGETLEHAVDLLKKLPKS